MKVTQQVNILLQHINPQSLEKSLEVITNLSNFISFCIGKTVKIISLVGQNPNHFQTFENSKMEIFYDIPIYTLGQVNENYKTVDPRMVLINFDDIKENANFYITNWFKMNNLGTVIYLYLDVLRFNSEMPIEQRFLCLVQAIETYHRKTKINFADKQEKHKERIKTIINSVPEEHKTWLKEKLNFSNEPTLQHRLEEMFNEDFCTLSTMDPSKKEDFIKKVKHTRNYYTHYDIKNEKNILKGENLEITCNILMTLIEYYILKEIKLPIEVIKNKIGKRIRKIYKNRY